MAVTLPANCLWEERNGKCEEISFQNPKESSPQHNQWEFAAQQTTPEERKMGHNSSVTDASEFTAKSLYLVSKFVVMGWGRGPPKWKWRVHLMGEGLRERERTRHPGNCEEFEDKELRLDMVNCSQLPNRDQTCPAMTISYLSLLSPVPRLSELQSLGTHRSYNTYEPAKLISLIFF